ncbi:sodium-dependent transporter [Thalassolituus sp. UBA3500]|uniref:sodium-dependent transporter n=1 Tax=Thalassolituus sp. UBA3500 TaxID=1947664 RepID=UPI000C101936|nr:sodium-dependent transporter [Thalassolituus sp. UBA3500]MBN56939.1 sodium-dependent transporter [Oceanospirillaceae bacterium]
MTSDKRGMHGIWASRWTFILAAVGSAVGLGNIWKFPYITGEYGGGAFVMVYLLCILSVGIPVMMAEVLLGRKARMSPINTMHRLTAKYKAPAFFSGIGWMGAVAGFFILSFYSVIAGWTLYYSQAMVTGTFVDISAEDAGALFGGLLADPGTLIGYHTLFLFLVGFVISRGVHRGLETSLRLLMPLLFVMLLVLLGYSLTTPGFSQGWDFLFRFEPEKLTQEAVVTALGHSFFTLSLGMGAIMAYGAYMPANSRLGKTILTVGALDTLVALVAGLVIFPIVFSNGLEPGSGPGLMFQTLPIAFGQLPGGVVIGTAFFVLVAIAAWSSAISLAEPAVAWAVEKGFSRGRATIAVCALAWVIGLGTVMSFNEWENHQYFVSVEGVDSAGEVQHDEFLLYADVGTLKESLGSTGGLEYEVKGKTFFDVLDFLTTNILLPVGGVLISLFVGWFMTRRAIADEARMKSERLLTLWRFMIRVVSPLAVLFVFYHGLL